MMKVELHRKVIIYKKNPQFMFTGIVKLAQVDDYITPSQNCIQPKIMKPSQKQKATVSLNDCLACSGCLTSAESVLVEQMSVTKLLTQLAKPDAEVNFIVAPQSVLSIARAHAVAPQAVFRELARFLKGNFKTNKVLDLYEGIIHCQQLVLKEYLQSKGRTILCSQCPGWVCYAEKTLPESVVGLMSKVKSPQQVMASILKKQRKGALVVSVMPCYDKKLQAIRFDIQKDIKEVDITITTVELLELYKTVTGQSLAQAFAEDGNKQQQKIDRLYKASQAWPYCLIEDPVSNGYLQSLIRSLEGEAISRKQVRNSDFIEYQFVSKGEKVKMAKCYGFRNIQKVVQAIKKGKCEYSYVQIMACPGGCYSGGGQIKVQNAKPKQSWEQMHALARELMIAPSQQAVESMQVPQGDQLYATYKVIEKSLSQSVMNW